MSSSDKPGTIKRGACPRCGGDMKAEQVEYGVEWVCLSMCGARLTPEQLEKAIKEKEAREKLEASVKTEEEINQKVDKEPTPDFIGDETAITQHEPIPERGPDRCPDCGAQLVFKGDELRCSDCDKYVGQLTDIRPAREGHQSPILNNSPGNNEATSTKKERKRARNCKKGCEFYRTDGKEDWCITKKCPSHYPHRLRPPYHPPGYKQASGAELSEKEKDEVIAYARIHGSKMASRRFKIPWTTIRTLVAARTRLEKDVKKGKKVDNRKLILEDLPPWNESWADDVKVEWLRTFRSIKGTDIKEEKD